MKKLFLFAFVLTSMFAFSQETTFGAKGGLNFSNLKYDDSEEEESDADVRVGFYIGGFADIAVSEDFHFQPELLYSIEGAGEIENEDDSDVSVSFLRVPLLAKYYLAEGLGVMAGPTLGFKVGADDEIDDALKSLDIQASIGASYELESGLFFDARYNLGLSNISDINDVDYKTRNFQIGVGYRF